MKDIKWVFLGNIADHGCGVIAAYNVLQYYNSNINFGDVLNELLWMGGPLGMGKLGTQWSIMTKFLCKKFWVVHTASSWTYLWGIKPSYPNV